MVLGNTGKYRATKQANTKPSNEPDKQNREDNSEYRIRQALEDDAIDLKYGFERCKNYSERTGFLINMHSTEILDEDKRLIAAVDYYFMEEDGTRFKVSLPFKPYFYILAKKEHVQEVAQFVQKKFSGTIGNVEIISKEDLDLPNHLIGLKQRYLKLSFFSVTDLIKVRKEIMPAVRKNREREKSNTLYTEMLASALANQIDASTAKVSTNHLENIVDIREYDVPYHVRVSIDKKIFCGLWYTVKCKGTSSEPPVFIKRDDLIERPDLIVLAFDIETTKLPLKFPDAQTDQIMMISYMIDGQGFLITNREIISSDVDDFEYTPTPEFEGVFTIFNEANEMQLLQKFFDHILEVRPHIFVTYNGDFFDWPFVETRAAVHELDMKREIGFYKNKEGVYCSRPAMHMDCLCWVKRDSYLPVGSQNLKAVAKAKLRYDPVELDPEDMCQLATEQPQVLSNYSVSDAVATYYLYMKYVHPFIFALCTIIPAEPDEVLRKGSGTLCETLLMVEAFHANIIFPNKQETELTKLTDDGHVLHQETYVGGHVEALESGVFRSDLPCRFRLDPDAFDGLIAELDKTLRHAIEVEEGVPISLVTNLSEIKADICGKLEALRDAPCRIESPVIYHLDVGAMYPNIILTNRLQPCAMVDETICAACDFNKPDATCQRSMAWTSRVEYMPATRNEYQRIKLQLETEKFPSAFPGGQPRAFHHLSKEDQAEYEKKRLTEYCRKVYKKLRVTRIMEKATTICQKENSFYVDTVRAFRDRRYEYKAMNKKAKQQVAVALASKDAGAIKSAKNREVLYDSLQLAHKCILNSFYGYVMRRGARWFSMEMAGIVCHTGANIIRRAREIIEQIGRPLELDTDGIWCVLPASFPENYTVATEHERKKSFNISFPNAVLNSMVKDHFTNDQYHELVDADRLAYEQRSENTIFFEVDGPYLAMVLPASKEEGKRLKKRYAVFNFDGSLAELKGFEVKRRGELQLIKIFQSSVFEAFLKGETLEKCYAAVAKIADYWLDVLYSRGKNMPDSELFDLISENRSMSKKLEDYGSQKSTSISTAKRLAEFLGDQMVKDAGLACKYIISRKPEGAPVTERAIPLAIFQSDDTVKHHFLRKWTKDSSITHVDIRDILDWNYYIERLSGAIQKIITIPAAMQGVANPVPRVRHPDWLHKRMLEKNDNFKQRRISDMFTVQKKSVGDDNAMDIEDVAGPSGMQKKQPRPVAVVRSKRKRDDVFMNDPEDILKQSWKEALGPPPKYGRTKAELVEWIRFHKKKWEHQAKQRALSKKNNKKSRLEDDQGSSSRVVRTGNMSTLGGFLRKTQRVLLDSPWHIIQIVPTNKPGEYKLWALVGQELHHLKLCVPRIFYANLKNPKCSDLGALWTKCNRILPRARPVFHLYRYSVPEQMFMEHGNKVFIDLSDPDIEGIYETQMTLEFRALMHLGSICYVDPREYGNLKDTDTFSLEQLGQKTGNKLKYLSQETGCMLKNIYLYHNKSPTGPREMYGLFLTPSKRALIIVVDSVATNLMPNLKNSYNEERNAHLRKHPDGETPPDNISFEQFVETDLKQAYRRLQQALQAYKDEKKGPTLLTFKSPLGLATLQARMPILIDFPMAQIHIDDLDNLYSTLEWQKVGVKAMMWHYVNSCQGLELMVEQSRYFSLPVGNLPADPTLYGADLLYARHLQSHNFVLWCSSSDKPDLGGSEESDARLIAEYQESPSEVTNNPGCYSSVCVELDVDSLAINTLLQSLHVNDIEGTTTFGAFDSVPQTSIDDMVGQNASYLATYDDTARCSEAFRVLRSVATSWMRDVTVHRDKSADYLVVHFYRWLRSPKTILYDPAILKTLQNLMKKLFMQLIAEFKRLGSIIIYANFNKIIICTKKRTVADAIGYMEFIMASIKNKELFHGIEMSYSECWEYLIWMDMANYGGVRGTLPTGLRRAGEQTLSRSYIAEEEEENSSTNETTENEGPTISMNWNIIEHLANVDSCKNSFRMIVAGYIAATYQHLSTNGQNMANPRRPATTQSSQAPLLGLAAYDNAISFAENLIGDEMSQELFKFVEGVHRRVPHVEAPPLAGSVHGGRINPALEFTKAICHVLALDPALEESVLALKRNLLRLLGVGEFSDEAAWTDPSVSYVLPGVICKACNHCRDVDLGRDNHKSSDKSAWLCPICSSNYDNVEIEALLLDTVNRKMLSWNLQDLQCKKCAQIKLENIIKRCQCAGDFRCLMSRTELLKLLDAFKTIATAFKMPTLLETVEHSLALIF